MACDVVMARQCHRKHGNVHRMNLTSQEEILAEREAPSSVASRSSRGPFGSSDSDGGISPGSVRISPGNEECGSRHRGHWPGRRARGEPSSCCSCVVDSAFILALLFDIFARHMMEWDEDTQGFPS